MKNYIDVRVPVPNAIKRQVVEKSNGECKKCGEKAVGFQWCRGVPLLHDNGGTPFEIHHKLSPLDGGTNDIDNLELLCRPCNRKQTKRNSALVNDKLNKVLSKLEKM